MKANPLNTALLLLWFAACSTPVAVERATAPPLPTVEPANAEILLPQQLDLAQAVDLVLAHNPNAHLAAAHLAQATAALDASRSAFQPQVNANWNYLHADAPSAYLYKTIDARRYQPGTNFNDPGTFDNWELGLQVGYNLYAGGQHALGVEIAELEQRLGQLGELAVRNQLAAATFQTWYQIMAAQEQITAAKKSLETVRAQRQEVQHLVEEGQSLKSDLLSLDVRLAEAEEQQLAAEQGEQLAKVALANLLAIPAAELPPLDLQQGPAFATPASLEEALRLAFSQRPELEAARTRLQQAQLRVSQADASQRPRVDLFGQSWADNPDMDFQGSEANWTLGFAVSWNLFDGGANQARSAEARAQRLASKAADRKAWLQIQADVEAAYLRLEDAGARLEVANKAVAFAEESLRLVQAQFEGGNATITRFLEAEAMRTQALIRQAQANYALLSASVDLSRAMGNLGMPTPEEVQ